MSNSDTATSDHTPTSPVAMHRHSSSSLPHSFSASNISNLHHNNGLSSSFPSSYSLKSDSVFEDFSLDEEDEESILVKEYQLTEQCNTVAQYQTLEQYEEYKKQYLNQSKTISMSTDAALLEESYNLIFGKWVQMERLPLRYKKINTLLPSPPPPLPQQVIVQGKPTVDTVSFSIHPPQQEEVIFIPKRSLDYQHVPREISNGLRFQQSNASMKRIFLNKQQQQQQQLLKASFVKISGANTKSSLSIPSPTSNGPTATDELIMEYIKNNRGMILESDVDKLQVLPVVESSKIKVDIQEQEEQEEQSGTEHFIKYLDTQFKPHFFSGSNTTRKLMEQFYHLDTPKTSYQYFVIRFEQLSIQMNKSMISSVEPFFCKAYLFDTKLSKRISQEYAFHFNDAIMLNFLHPSIQTMIPPASPVLYRINTQENNINDVILIVIVERILNSNMDELFKVCRDGNVKQIDKLRMECKEQCHRMGNHFLRQPFLYGFCKIKEGNHSIYKFTKLSNHIPIHNMDLFYQEEVPIKYQLDQVFKLHFTMDLATQDKLSSWHLEYLSKNPSPQSQSQSQQPQPQQHTVSMEQSLFTYFPLIPSFPSCVPTNPPMQYQNSIYLYPIALEHVSDYKSILIKAILPNQQVYYSSIWYHNKNPHFMDEIRYDIPIHPSHDVSITLEVYHVKISNKFVLLKIGTFVLPLFDHYLLVQDGYHTLYSGKAQLLIKTMQQSVVYQSSIPFYKTCNKYYQLYYQLLSNSSGNSTIDFHSCEELIMEMTSTIPTLSQESCISSIPMVCNMLLHLLGTLDCFLMKQLSREQSQSDEETRYKIIVDSQIPLIYETIMKSWIQYLEQLETLIGYDNLKQHLLQYVYYYSKYDICYCEALMQMLIQHHCPLKYLYFYLECLSKNVMQWNPTISFVSLLQVYIPQISSHMEQVSLMKSIAMSCNHSIGLLLKKCIPLYGMEWLTQQLLSITVQDITYGYLLCKLDLYDIVMNYATFYHNYKQVAVLCNDYHSIVIQCLCRNFDDLRIHAMEIVKYQVLKIEYDQVLSKKKKQIYETCFSTFVQQSMEQYEMIIRKMNRALLLLEFTCLFLQLYPVNNNSKKHANLYDILLSSVLLSRKLDNQIVKQNLFYLVYQILKQEYFNKESFEKCSMIIVHMILSTPYFVKPENILNVYTREYIMQCFVPYYSEEEYSMIWNYLIGSLLAHCNFPSQQYAHPVIHLLLQELLQVYPCPLEIQIDDSFKEEDAIEYIQQSNQKIVFGGTLLKLVERLFYDEYQHPPFYQTFLLTYLSFTNALELLEYIKYCILKKITPQETKVIRLLLVLKHWIKEHYTDMDSIFISQFVQFINNECSQFIIASGNNEPYRMLYPLIKMLVKKLLEIKINIFNYSSALLDPILPKNFQQVCQMNKFDMLLFASEELARQCCLIDSQLYKNIHHKELFHEPRVNVDAMTKRFNNISNWVISEIIRQEDVNRRVMKIRKFVEICEYLKKFNNFHCLFAIYAGLQNNAIYKLQQTWNMVGTEYLDRYTKCTALFKNNMIDYRKELDRASPPVVPYLGVYMSDLLMNNETGDYLLPKPGLRRVKLINFNKRILYGKVIGSFRQKQTRFYNFRVVPYLYKVLTVDVFQDLIDEEEAFQRMCKYEGKVFRA